MAQPHGEKRKQALRFAVALAYLGLSSQQRVSLYSMSETVRTELPPLRGQGNVEKIIQAVTRLQYAGVTDLEQSFTDFRPSRQRMGLIFVISDFYGKEIGSAAEAVSRAAGWPGEVHFIQVLHRSEREPTLQGEVELAEVETGESRRFWLTQRDVEAYTQAFDAFSEELTLACAGRQIDFSQCWADEPFEERFLTLLTRAAALSGGA